MVSLEWSCMGFVVNVFIDVETTTNVDDIPQEYIVEKSEIDSSTVSIELGQVEGVSELEFSDSVSIDFEDGRSVNLSDARLMGAGESSGY